MPKIKDTHIFKSVTGCDLRADVYRAAGDSARPAIFWMHGGALIGGWRGDIPAEQRRLYVAAGYTVVSIDYRLAPETKLIGIIEDVQDAYRWMRSEGPARFNIDIDRVAAIGHSAGGYLALMTGFCVAPRPRALVSFYGYGDITAKWYSEPDPGYCRQPPVPKEEAYSAVGVGAGPVASGVWEKGRGRYYLYLRQNGLWPLEVAGHDPQTEDEAFDPYCPIRNVTAEYPPTMLLHGEHDADVPCQQSVDMAEELNRAGVEHEFITISEGAHTFDCRENGIKEPVVAKAFESKSDR
ncbi:MAG: alpha/beta hydrolase, partial [Planctomycetia bacterium]|nr:alpha/beta hydrolase [Planctomycetia bacterium]